MHGTAVIASRHGGFIDSIGDGQTGFLVTPGDTGELASRLVEMLGDRDRCECMGAAARARILERYTLERMVREYRDIYEELLSEQKREHA